MHRREGSRGGSRAGTNERSGGRRDNTRSIVTTKLFVGNLPADITSSELREHFVNYGTVTECDVVNKDYGFVHFSTPEEADAACEALNETNIMGSEVRVQKSTGTKRGGEGSDRGSGRGRCFKCNEVGHWSRECPNEGDGRYGSQDVHADPYDNPLIERYRRTIDLLHERIRYLEDLLATRPPLDTRSSLDTTADPYARPSPDHYNSRRTAVMQEDFDDYRADEYADSRSAAGKVSGYNSYRQSPY